MKIDFEGRTWDFDEDEIDLKQATVLYMTYKMTLGEWIEGIGKADQRALGFAYWLMLQQNGVVKPIADCNPKIVAFAVAYGTAREEAAAANAVAEAEAATVAAVPTIPPSPSGDPPSPEPSTPTATSPLSPVPELPLTGS